MTMEEIPGGVGGGGESFKATSVAIRQVKTDPKERATRSMRFGVFGSEWWRHRNLRVKTRGDVRRVLMSLYNGLQPDMGSCRGHG